MKKKSFGDYVGATSSWFVRNFRTTFILLFVALVGGYLAYTQFLPREGFPEVAFPQVYVTVESEILDPTEVNEQIVEPIVDATEELESIARIDSISNPGYAFIILNLQAELDAKEESEVILEAFDERLELPESANLQILAFRNNTFDGENDIILSLYGKQDQSVFELQEKATELQTELENIDEVQAINIKNIVSEGEQTSFNRIGIRENEESETVTFYESIAIGVVKEPNVTTTEISEAINNKLNDLEELALLDGYGTETVADFADTLNNDINSLQVNAGLAVLAVAIIVFLLVNWRASLITALFIPAVMGATFLTMTIFGVSINTISLFGLILVLGLLVDDVIVIVEIIDYEKKQGKRGLEAIRSGISGIGKADVIGTLTTVLVFFPMLFITGFLGDIVEDIPVTVIIALVMSLLIALTIIPLLAYIVIPDRKSNNSNNALDSVLNFFSYGALWVGKQFGNMVRWYLGTWWKMLIVAGIGILFIVSGGYLAGLVRQVDFPSPKDSDSMTVSISYDFGSSVEEQIGIAKDVEEIIVDRYGEYISEYNYPNVDTNFLSGNFTAESYVELTDRQARDISSVDIAEDLNEQFAQYEDADVFVGAVTNGPPVAEYPSRIQVYNNDIEVATDIAEEIATFIRNDVEIRGNAVDDVRLEYTQTFATLNGRRYVEVQTNLDEIPDSGAVAQIQSKVDAEFDEDKLVEMGVPSDSLDADTGFDAEITESVQSAGIAILLSFVAMYVFLVMIFGSFGKSFLIMLGVPFSFFGLFGGLLVTDNPTSFFVMIGVIALIGIVVNNTVMLLDFANQEREKGAGIRESIARAIEIRFRPLVTTSITTLVGLLPLAISEPFWESLAFTIIFGLLSSTIMVLFIFPAYYTIIEGIRQWAQYNWRIKLFARLKK